MYLAYTQFAVSEDSSDGSVTELTSEHMPMDGDETQANPKPNEDMESSIDQKNEPDEEKRASGSDGRKIVEEQNNKLSPVTPVKKETRRIPKDTEEKTEETNPLSKEESNEKDLDNSKDPLSEQPKERASDTEETKIRYKWAEFPVMTQFIEAEFTEDISSNRAELGQEVFLRCLNEIKVSDILIIEKGARVRGKVNDVKASYGNSRATLSIEIDAVENVSGDWMAIQYPSYSNKKKKEIIFTKGTKLTKLKLKSATARIQIPL